jgi:hypothetical protein
LPPPPPPLTKILNESLVDIDRGWYKSACIAYEICSVHMYTIMSGQVLINVTVAEQGQTHPLIQNVSAMCSEIPMYMYF